MSLPYFVNRLTQRGVLAAMVGSVAMGALGLTQAAHAAVHRAKFNFGGNYALVEVLDDDLIHVEYASGSGPAAGTPIYNSPMVGKTNYSGPTSVSQNGGVIDTPEMQASFNTSTGCLSITDKVKNAYLTTICPKDLNLGWKGIDIDNAQMQNVYGLGQNFKAVGNADGDWVQHGKFETGGEFGNHFAGFNGGANSQVQFPVMYALGANNKNFALFLDNVYKQSWNFQTSWWQSRMNGEHIRFFVMTGGDLINLRKDYMELSGKPPVPPKKAFGLWVSEFGFDNWSEIDWKLGGLRNAKFPVDGFVLDLQWFGSAQWGSPDSAMGRLDWDLNNFPNPTSKIASYKNDHVGLIAIEESYVAKNQWSYQQMNNAGRLIHNCNTQAPVEFNAWMGITGMIDWADEPGAAWWHDTLRWNNLIQKGVLGHWTDLGEPERYDSNGCYATVEPGKFRHPDHHNLYNFLWHKSIYEGYWRKRFESQQRPFLMARAGAPGLQRFGASMWSGDIASRLDVLSTHMNAQMHMAFAGIDYYGSDLGGFWRKEVPFDTATTNGWAPSEGEMYTQWFANSAWFDVPVRPHTYNCGFNWLPAACPYKVAPNEIGNVNSNLANIRQRYELTPYYYSLAYQAYTSGDPVIAPPVMYYQNDATLRKVGHQKLVGRNLMVGVVAKHGEGARGMYLPAGKWINYHTNQWYNSTGQWINNIPTFVNNVRRLPVFAKAGALIPQMYVDDKTKDVFGNRTDNTTRDELIVRVYPDTTASQFTLYEDDGTTVTSYDADKRPLYQGRQTVLSQSETNTGVTVEIAAAVGTYAGAVGTRNNEIRLVVNGKSVSDVKLNGVSLPARASFNDFYANDAGWFDTGNNQILARSGGQFVHMGKTFEFVYGSAPCPNCSGTQRTVVFLGRQTISGQDLFIRGGIDWDYAAANMNLNCAVDKWLCAIPMTHLNLKFTGAALAQRTNDLHLDWYGDEPGQGADIEGSPLAWTTNNASNPNKVDVNGYGYTPLNTWGDHMWMLDVNMDCSKTVNGWFELKGFLTNHNVNGGWEPSVTQVGAPYVTGNHFAQCGKINKFDWGQSGVEVKSF
jgi:alpha-glucosidase (family GH31 glycosyl hydrolase)